MKEGNKISWAELHGHMCKAALVRMDEHNRRYPTLLESKDSPIHYKRSFPGRVKLQEKNTLVNILRQYCQQLAGQVNSGKRVVTNIVLTNRLSARQGNGCKRVTPRHIAKGVFAGILLGDQVEGEGVPGELIFIKDEKKGARPYKQFHGAGLDFELLVHPDLVPDHLLPPGVTFEAATHFPDPAQADLPALATPASKPMQRKTPNLSGKLETSNKTIRVKVADEAPAISAEREAGNSKNDRPENQAAQVGPEDTPARDLPRTSSDGVSAGSCSDPKQNSFSALMLAGQMIEAYVALLLNSYLKNLGETMGRTYHPRELENARQAIRQLLASCDPRALDGFVDRCLLTIDHMKQWILYHQAQGNSRGLANPSRWFSITYKHNIKGAYENFLKPWQETGLAFKQPKQGRPSKQNRTEDAITRKQSTWHNLAFLMKYRLLPFHPTDRRLKSADLTKWADDIRKLNKLDKQPPEQIEKVLDWMISSQGSRAKFWRKETGGFGLRSASGFRRNFKMMQSQMIEEQVRQSKYQENPGKRR